MALDPRQIELAVLLQAVELHPASLTPAELVRRVSGERDEEGAVTDAIRALEIAGLLRHNGNAVTPTDAAIRAVGLLTL